MPRGGRDLLNSGRGIQDAIKGVLKCLSDCNCGSKDVCQITNDKIVRNLVLPLRTLDLYGMPASSIAILVKNGLPLPTESEFLAQDTTGCISYGWSDAKKSREIKEHIKKIMYEISLQH